MVVPVRDVMKTNVITASLSETVHSAARRMVEENVGCIVVCENNKPVGMLTNKDLVKKVIYYNIPLGTKVKDVMTAPITTAESLTPVVEIARLMDEKNIKRIPILDPYSKELVGIVTARDLVGIEANMITILRNYIETTNKTKL